MPNHRPIASSKLFPLRSKMREIKQVINAGHVNSGSTAKCLKTQAFYSQVNSCQSNSCIHFERTSGSGFALTISYS